MATVLREQVEERSSRKGPQAVDGDPVGMLVGGLRRALDALRARGDSDRFANPIKLMAAELGQRLASGELDEPLLETLLQRLTLTAARSRAGRLRSYLGELDEGANTRRIAELIEGLACASDGSLLPFDAFQASLARIQYGFVVTAHPTFSLAVELQRQLLALAEAGEPPVEALAALEAAQHRPNADLGLDAEHERSLEAIRNLQAACERMRVIAIEISARLYPERWREVSPRLVGIATWVGYDTDGRSDIPWSATFAKRLRVKLEQLARYRQRVLAIRAASSELALVSVLELIEARLSLALRAASEELAVFAAVAGSPPGAGPIPHRELARVSRAMLEAGPSRLVERRHLLELVDRALELATARDPQIQLVSLRAEILTQGLAAARSHLRINALQLHNAVRKSIGMDHAPDDPSFKRSYQEALAQLIEQVRPAAINFGAVQDERATAPRVFMTMKQMLKFIDGDEPLRFLIAECETPLTLLSALYFAKLFGIDDRVDISPLFETRKALDRGAAIIEEALEVPAYRSYVRQRGRLCVQTGFSDAGRFLGQLAAVHAIERLRLDLAGVISRAGLTEVELVLFDTHGESIGRGGHPHGLADRFLYLDSPEGRRRFAAAGIRHRQESSFQGGDGYLNLLSERAALAVLRGALEHVLSRPEDEGDAFYEDQGYVPEFFAAIEQFNARVIADPAYAALLTSFGTNLLFPAGSRSVKRQFDHAGVSQAIEHPSQVRAIPHNAILQQLGILANTIGGLGHAIGRNPERFQELYRESPRFRRLMMMVEYGFMYTDLEVVRAYADLFDPGFWLRSAAAARDPKEREELTLVSDHVERIGLFEKLQRILRVFERDHLDLRAALRRHRRLTRDAGDEPIAVDPETRDTMHILHALRLALIERVMRRAVHVPDFSDRHGLTHGSLVTAIMQLDVEPALRALAEIFPVIDHPAEPSLDYGEPVTYAQTGSQSYAQEHQAVFRPIGEDYDRIRRIGTALIHHLGATG